MAQSSLTRLATLLVFLASTAVSLQAQAVGRVQGRVLDANTLHPLGTVQVWIEGTNLGTLTDARGDFLIRDVPVGPQTVRASIIGYTDQEQAIQVSAGETSRVEFSLRVTAIELDEIVVTGTPGPVSKRTLGNSITTINAAEITEQTTTSNAVELLQARSPGVQILPNAGVPGTRSDIRVRGASSLTDYAPVVYVDGVRFNIDNLGTFTPSGASTTSFRGQQTSALDLINPEDIESIEVIKGPAAATLYGSEAANGVIQIITKKGGRGQQPMRFDLRAEQGWNDWAIDIPANYTVCTQARIDERDAGGNVVWPGCQGVAAGTVLTDVPLERDPLALRAGDVQRLSLSARGGGQTFSYYVAATGDFEEGVFLNSHNDRKSVRANFVITPNEKLDFQVNSSYMQGDLRLPVGDESAQGLLLSGFRGSPGRVPPAGDPERAGWLTTNPRMANAYDNTTTSDRFTIGTTISVLPVPWFRSRLTLGVDYSTGLAQILSPPGSVDADFAGAPGGIVAQRTPRTLIYTIDYAGNLEFPLNPDFQSTTSFGIQAIARKREDVFASGRGFGAASVLDIGTAQFREGDNSFVEDKNLGYFLQEQIGWKNRLFVTGAVRLDDHSAFGENFDVIAYPKASISWILSEEPSLESLFESARASDFKFRAAYGHAGRAPSPFSATQTWTVDQVAVGTGAADVGSALRARAIGNPDLAAERGEELEVGFDAGFFDDRLGVDFTYYRKRMKDVIIAQGVPGSTGFGGTFYGGTQTQQRNLGETLNKGIEALFTLVPVQRRNFAWESRISLATNSNELISFGDTTLTFLNPGGQSYGTVQQHREGYPIGGYWVQLPQRNADGTPVLNASNVVQLEPERAFLGPSAPKREIGFANTFRLFRDFRVYVLFDYKGGHYVFNAKEFQRCYRARNCERLADPNNVDPVTGEILNPEAYVWTQNIAGAWVEKANFLKLRDVSLSYTLPAQWARAMRANTASVTLAGHNLALWSGYSGIDPEVNSYGDVNFARADVYPLPMIRRVSFSVNLSF